MSAGLHCDHAASIVQVQSTSSTVEGQVVSDSCSPLRVILLLYGGSHPGTGIGCASSSLQESLASIGPQVLPPRGTLIDIDIRCIASNPPVCIACTHVEHAVAAAASVLPDLVLLLPSCPTSSSQAEVVHLKAKLPSLPIISTLSPPVEAASMCRLLIDDSCVDWKEFAAASSSAASYIRCPSLTTAAFSPLLTLHAAPSPLQHRRAHPASSGCSD